MISQQAKDAFDYTATGALMSALCDSTGSRGDIEGINDITHIKENKVVLLTVSSYLFRVMTMIYFTLDKDTKNHFAAINKADAGGMSESDFLDVIGECGNICCGALTRELARHFPHLGMSTPNVLDRDCAKHLQELGASYVKHFKIRINHTLTLHASLCVCDFADIDFAVDRTQTDDNNGELEMF